MITLGPLKVAYTKEHGLMTLEAVWRNRGLILSWAWISL
jgi:hypothetical protein